MKYDDIRPIIIIPARYNSTRLDKKLLLSETGKPLIVHTYENALSFNYPIVVVTDSDEIHKTIRSIGGYSIRSITEHQNGTSRICEAISINDKYKKYNVIINLQGDEPTIPYAYINKLLKLISDGWSISTLAVPINIEDNDENVVKVTVDNNNRALYFSRSLIPHGTKRPLKHLGIYAYRRNTLLKLYNMPGCKLEEIEKLEQLKALYYGIDIAVGIVDTDTISINTRKDYDEFKLLIDSQ